MLRNRMKANRGSALLVVVVIMSILFMMSSIVLGYALRQYRLREDINYAYMSDTYIHTARSKAIEEIVSLLDQADEVGSFTLTSNEDGFEYRVYVNEDSSGITATGNKSSYKYDRDSLTGSLEEAADASDAFDMALASAEQGNYQETRVYLEAYARYLYLEDPSSTGNLKSKQLDDAWANYNKHIDAALDKLRAYEDGDSTAGAKNSLNSAINALESVVRNGGSVDMVDFSDVGIDVNLQGIAIEILTIYKGHRTEEKFLLDIVGDEDQPDYYDIDITKAH